MGALRKKKRSESEERSTLAPVLRAALAKVTDARAGGIALALTYRYGVASVRELPESEHERFAGELEAALSGQAPHPADALLDPADRFTQQPGAALAKRSSIRKR